MDCKIQTRYSPRCKCTCLPSEVYRLSESTCHYKLEHHSSCLDKTLHLPWKSFQNTKVDLHCKIQTLYSPLSRCTCLPSEVYTLNESTCHCKLEHHLYCLDKIVRISLKPPTTQKWVGQQNPDTMLSSMQVYMFAQRGVHAKRVHVSLQTRTPLVLSLQNIASSLEKFTQHKSGFGFPNPDPILSLVQVYMLASEVYTLSELL